MQVLSFMKYAAATFAVALGFSSASADKIAFVGDGQTYNGGGDVVSLPVGSLQGNTYGLGKPVTISLVGGSASFVYTYGINWASQIQLVLTPADGVVINSVTFSGNTDSANQNSGTIKSESTDLQLRPSSKEPVITFPDLEKADALTFTHTGRNVFYYVEIDYTSENSGSDGTAEIGATFKPNPITVDYEEIRIDLSGVWAEFGTEYTNYDVPLQVETASGTPYTTVKLTSTMDNQTFEDYWRCDFAKRLEVGTYKIIVPAGKFVRRDGDGEIYLANLATTWSFTVEEAVVVDPDKGFDPSSIYPASGETIDSSEIEWMIAVFFNNKVITNPGVTPYLLIDGDKYEASEIVPINTGMQVNYFFAGMDKRPNGDYTFILPAGAVSYEDGQTNNAFDANYLWQGGGKSDVEIGECKLVSATIGDINIMEPGVVVPNIPGDGCYLTLNVLPEIVGLVYVSISDVTGKTPDQYNDSSIEAVWSNYIDTKQGNVFTKEIYSINGYKLYEGHDYVVKAALYDGSWGSSVIGTVYSAVFTGETPEFKYSPVEIVSIEPTPGSEFKIGEKMVVTYSAPVNLVIGEGKSGFGKGNAGWANFSSMSSNADKTVWTIGFPNAEINEAGGPGQINPRLWGTDSNGLQLRPAEYDLPAGASEDDYDVFNSGENESSYTQINYAGYAKCPKVVVSPLETEELSYIDFSIVNSKELNPSYMADFPVIRNEAGEEVALVLVDSYEDEGGHVIVTKMSSDAADAGVIGLRAPLNNVITTPGVYTLELPWNLFVVGREQSSYASAPGTFLITVGKEDPAQISFSCEGAKNMNVDFIPADEEESTPAYYMVTLETSNDIAEVAVSIPAGYDDLYYNFMQAGGLKPRRVPVSTAIDDYGFTKAEGNIIPVNADGKSNVYMVAFGKGDDVDLDNYAVVIVTADKTTGIEELVTDVEAAEYFTIDGVKVEKPVKGLYIKVTEGKATKVIL